MSSETRRRRKGPKDPRPRGFSGPADDIRPIERTTEGGGRGAARGGPRSDRNAGNWRGFRAGQAGEEEDQGYPGHLIRRPPKSVCCGGLVRIAYGRPGRFGARTFTREIRPLAGRRGHDPDRWSKAFEGVHGCLGTPGGCRKGRNHVDTLPRRRRPRPDRLFERREAQVHVRLYVAVPRHSRPGVVHSPRRCAQRQRPDTYTALDRTGRLRRTFAALHEFPFSNRRPAWS